MDLRKLKKLIDLVQESGIAELEVTESDAKVRIVRGGEAPREIYVGAPQMISAPAPAAAPAAGAAAPAAAPEAATPAGHVVQSPMVGTFYRAPSPGAKPFVEV